MTTLTEWDTRLVPYEGIEESFARNRPYAERPPIPRVGDEVFYRRESWDQHPVRVTVTWVQDLDDREDPNLWTVIRDGHGRPIVDFGQVRMVRALDPWPKVKLQGFWSHSDYELPILREAITWESRMRGSPGWLPLNWRERPVRLPSDLVVVPRPVIPPSSVPYEQFVRQERQSWLPSPAK